MDRVRAAGPALVIPALALLFSACGGGERAPEAEPPSEAREEALASLGYASGVSPAPEETGVTTLDAEAVASGLRLYTSGHAPVAILMDVRGRVLHEWSASYLEVWPGRRAVHRAGD
ncbi:MAG TPA: hypothetical protein VKU85_13740, partial [bacterium]|nr:hypothetical protein [bacterium]